MPCSFHASSMSSALTYPVKHVCTWIGQITLAKKLHKLNMFRVNGMWQYGTVDDDGDDEDGEESPQANDYVQQRAPQGLVPSILHHGQMFSFQELQEGLNSLRIHIDQGLDNLNMHMDTRLDHLQTHMDTKLDHF